VKQIMRLHFSISLKLTIIVVAVSAAVIFTLTMYNINEQAIDYENIYVDKARDISLLFDIFLSPSENSSSIQQMMTRTINTNEELISIDIYQQINGSAEITYTTNTTHLWKSADKYVNLSIQSKKQVKIPYHSDSGHYLTVITPQNVSGNQSGAYKLFFSLEESYSAFQSKSTNLLLISGISLIALIFSFLFLLRRTIVAPIIQFRDTATIYGKGNLSKRINRSSNDELGELATAFNEMAYDLQESREKIEEYNKILERLLDQKDAFIGQLGHDLKNPLQPLIGLLPILIQKEQDPKLREHLIVMNENALYMKELILKTLELAKLRSEDIQFEYTSLPLSRIVDEIITSENMFLTDHHISITNSITADITIWADSLRLKEVIKNLITNAVKYTPETGGFINITAKKNNGTVTISIRDTGIGMTKDQISRIFDEFYRADSTQHGADSVGLGLSIAKRIIEKHGGKIWAESRGPGKGSTFHFTLKTQKDI
jgi:signal transduction histidine kinase